SSRRMASGPTMVTTSRIRRFSASRSVPGGGLASDGSGGLAFDNSGGLASDGSVNGGSSSRAFRRHDPRVIEVRLRYAAPALASVMIVGVQALLQECQPLREHPRLVRQFRDDAREVQDEQ